MATNLFPQMSLADLWTQYMAQPELSSLESRDFYGDTTLKERDPNQFYRETNRFGMDNRADWLMSQGYVSPEFYRNSQFAPGMTPERFVSEYAAPGATAINDPNFGTVYKRPTWEEAEAAGLPISQLAAFERQSGKDPYYTPYFNRDEYMARGIASDPRPAGGLGSILSDIGSKGISLAKATAPIWGTALAANAVGAWAGLGETAGATTAATVASPAAASPLATAGTAATAASPLFGSLPGSTAELSAAAALEGTGAVAGGLVPSAGMMGGGLGAWLQNPQNLALLGKLGSGAYQLYQSHIAKGELDKAQAMLQQAFEQSDPFAAARTGARDQFMQWQQDPMSFMSSPLAQMQIDQLNRAARSKQAQLGQTWNIDPETGAIRGSGIGAVDFAKQLQTNLANQYETALMNRAQQAGMHLFPNMQALSQTGSLIGMQNQARSGMGSGAGVLLGEAGKVLFPQIGKAIENSSGNWF